MFISSLPVPDAKFQEANSDYLGQLIVTPEMVAKTIKAMKDNKAPGVDGIPPRLLMETVIGHTLLNPSQHGFLNARSCLANMICFFKSLSG